MSSLTHRRFTADKSRSPKAALHAPSPTKTLPRSPPTRDSTPRRKFHIALISFTATGGIRSIVVSVIGGHFPRRKNTSSAVPGPVCKKAITRGHVFGDGLAFLRVAGASGYGLRTDQLLSGRKER